MRTSKDACSTYGTSLCHTGERGTNGDRAQCSGRVQINTENFKNQKGFLEEEFGGGLKKSAQGGQGKPVLRPLLAPSWPWMVVTLCWLVTPPFSFSGMLDLDPSPLLPPPTGDSSSAATGHLG